MYDISPFSVLITFTGITSINRFVVSHSYRSKMLMASGEQRVSLSVIPMFHGYGVLNILKMFIDGGKIINLSKFDEELFLSAISRYKVI